MRILTPRSGKSDRLTAPVDDAGIPPVVRRERREPEPPSGDTIGRNAGFAFATQMSTALITAVLTLYLARQLGPEGFGIFSLALGLGGVLLMPAELGTSQAAARYVAERHGDNAAISGVLGMALPIRIASATAIAVALFALAEPIADAYGEPDLVWPLRGMAIAFFGQSLMMFGRSMFIALRRTTLAFALVASESVAELAATVALVVLGAGVTGAAFGRAAGYVFGAVLGMLLLARLLGAWPLRRGRPSPVTHRDFLGYSGAMLIVQGASAAFAQIDVLLLGAFLSASSVGVFAAPLRLSTALAYPGGALASAIAPRMARHATDAPQLGAMALGLRYMVMVQAAIVTVVVLWADPIVNLTLGSKFQESADILRGLGPAMFAAGISPLCVQPLNYAGEGRRRIPITIGALLLNAALDVALIPWIGVYGAVVGTAVAYTAYVGYHVWLCQRVLGLRLRPLGETAGRSLLAAGALAGILALVGTDGLSVSEWLAGLAGGGVAFIAVLLATRELSVGELRSLAAGVRRAIRG